MQLGGSREPVLLQFRKHQVAVDHDLELASGTLAQLRRDPARFLDLGRQTGGLGQVVSLNAVGDLDRRHSSSSPSDCRG